MMKEIGGYLEIEHNHGKEFHDTYAFNLGRNCLEVLIENKNIRKIYIPFFLCLSVEHVCKNRNIEINYYHIDEQFFPILDNFKLDDNTFVLIVNYFGQLSVSDVKTFKKKYGNIIVDNTQSFFEKHVENIDTFYNCRKYFGVPDGAYLFTDAKITVEYPVAHSYDRLKHLYGRLEENANKFYSFFSSVEEQFEEGEIEWMSLTTHNMLKGVSYSKILNIRKNNFKILHSFFANDNELKLKRTGTYMYPLLVNDGEFVRGELIKRSIYVPRFWPELDENKLNLFERNLYYNLLPLPIDQRYYFDDMQTIFKLIKEIRCKNEKN